MQWRLAEEQEAYRDTVRDWLGDAAGAATVRAWLDAGDHRSFGEAWRASGMAGVGVPEEDGGQGGGLVELALTAELFGASAVPSGAWVAEAAVLPALAAADGAVEGTLAGRSVVPGVPAGALLDAAPVLEVADGVVWGPVSCVLGAPEAAGLLVPVAGPEPGLALLDVGEGVEIAPRALLDRSRSAGDVSLTGARATTLTLDPQVLTTCAARSAVLVAADALGAMQRMLDLSVGYSLQRHQFGVPIGSFQAVKHTAAQMLVDVEAARSVVYYAAASVDAGAPQWLLHAAAAKAQVTAAAVRVADAALTVHGAIGYTWEYDLQLFSKRAGLDAVLFGAPARWNAVIADGVLSDAG